MSNQELTIRDSLNNEIRGDKDSILKIINNNNYNTYYLCKLMKGDEILYIEEVAAKQPTIRVGDNYFILAVKECLDASGIEAARLLGATATIGGFVNQAKGYKGLF